MYPLVGDSFRVLPTARFSHDADHIGSMGQTVLHGALTQEFVDKCPVEGGFRMRGLEMTRIEVFVDADHGAGYVFLVPFSGFAFALLGAWFPLIRSRRKWTKSTVKNTVG
jgi:hypothetical protein